MVLFSEAGLEPLEDRLSTTLAPLLNGIVTVEEIIAHLGNPIDAVWGLDRLRHRGLLEQDSPGIDMVFVRDPLDPRLADIPGEWMLVRAAGRTVWIGPVFGRTSCWPCLAARLRAVRRAWGVPEDAPLPNADVEDEVTMQVARGLAAAAMRSPSPHLRTFDLDTMQWREHPIIRRPDCPTCTGEARLDVVSALTGIVHGVTPLADGVCAARHNFTVAQTGARPGRSLGRGVDARTGAVAEAVERYCGIWRGDEPRIRASFRELGARAIHPNDVLLFEPSRFDEERIVDWVEAQSPAGGAAKYVAAAHCYYGYDSAWCVADSNGCAAGQTREQAMLHGLLELVERDAIAIWWYNRARRPALAKRNGAALLDLTTDLGIPVIAAVDGELLGFGAALDGEEAAARALAELSQARALVDARQYGRTYSGELTDRSFLEPHDVPAAPRASLDGLDPCIAHLHAHGLETFVVDQTRAEIGLPVVRVIVPGLRHFRARFAPGRLYDVPPRLGWISGPLRRHELNPAHLAI